MFTNSLSKNYKKYSEYGYHCKTNIMQIQRVQN
jgi:hypothetical protein